MNRILPKPWLRPITLAAMAAGLVVLAGVAAPAQARVFVGFGMPLVGPPAYYPPPPVYYPPPPVYYPPPPVYYPPPPVYYQPPVTYTPPQPYSPAPPGGQSCYAGAQVCPMEHPVPSGSRCYCTVNGQRVWGSAN